VLLRGFASRSKRNRSWPCARSPNKRRSEHVHAGAIRCRCDDQLRSADGSPIAAAIAMTASTRFRPAVAAMPKCFANWPERRGGGGFPKFSPDACLINRYEPGARVRCIRTKTSGISTRRSSRFRSLARDLPVRWLEARRQATRFQLAHGDIVYGRASRLFFHG